MSARRLVLAVGCAACSFGVAACGGFDSANSGEHLIGDYVAKFRQDTILVSARCPSGVSKRAGHSYICAVVLRDSKGQRHVGTISIEMLAGNKLAIDSTRDVHIR